MLVPLQNTTSAARGTQVFVRISGTSGTLLLGGCEAASGSGLIAIANTFFTGPADSTGLVEIAYNIYNQTT
jgi:hypothetical protein